MYVCIVHRTKYITFSKNLLKIAKTISITVVRTFYITETCCRVRLVNIFFFQRDDLSFVLYNNCKDIIIIINCSLLFCRNK